MLGKRVIFNFQGTKAKVKPLRESRLQITIFGPSRECFPKRHGLCREKKVSEVKVFCLKTKYRKVASTNASRFVTRLVYMHTQNYNFLIRR